MPTHDFRARLWEHSPGDPGSWHFVTLPLELAEEIAMEAGPPRGFGSVPVRVRIGRTTWRTSVFPDNGSESYVLPVKKPVRQAEGLTAGDRCTVQLEVVEAVDQTGKRDHAVGR